jgi:hypothetical protein
MLWIGLQPGPMLERLRPTSELVSERIRTVQVGEAVEPLARTSGNGEEGP